LLVFGMWVRYRSVEAMESLQRMVKIHFRSSMELRLDIIKRNNSAERARILRFR